jgi:hypothetical protein
LRQLVEPERIEPQVIEQRHDEPDGGEPQLELFVLALVAEAVFGR